MERSTIAQTIKQVINKQASYINYTNHFIWSLIYRRMFAHEKRKKGNDFNSGTILGFFFGLFPVCTDQLLWIPRLFGGKNQKWAHKIMFL